MDFIEDIYSYSKIRFIIFPNLSLTKLNNWFVAIETTFTWEIITMYYVKKKPI